MGPVNLAPEPRSASRREQSQAVRGVIEAAGEILYNRTKDFCRQYDWSRPFVYAVLQQRHYAPLDFLRDLSLFSPSNSAVLWGLVTQGLSPAETIPPHAIPVTLTNLVSAGLAAAGYVGADPTFAGVCGRREWDRLIVARAG